MKKKIIIIGGGIAGLSCGIFAQKLGFETAIYEKCFAVGGNCTGWQRDGLYIDNCMHWLTGTNRNSKYFHLWKMVGALNEETKCHQAENFYVSELDGKHIAFNIDVNKTYLEMLKMSPSDSRQIKRFIDVVKFCTQINNDETGKLKRANLYLKMFKRYGFSTIEDVANKFKNPLLKRAMCDYLPKEYSIYTLIFAYSTFVSKNGAVPCCGSLNFAKNIAKKYEECGGKIYLNSLVKKINIENNEFKSITIKGGKEVAGDYVVCAGDIFETFNALMESYYMPAKLKSSFINRKTFPVVSSFHTAFKVEDDKAPFNDVLVFNIKPITIGTQKYDRLFLKEYSYDENLSKHKKFVIQAYLIQNEKDYDYWDKLSTRKEDYNNQKKVICEQLLNEIISRFPKLTNKISVLDCWTPKTYNDYFNAYKGSYLSFGITTRLRKNINFKVNGLKNVFIATQWQSLFGGLPMALLNGKKCAEYIRRHI